MAKKIRIKICLRLYSKRKKNSARFEKKANILREEKMFKTAIKTIVRATPTVFEKLTENKYQDEHTESKVTKRMHELEVSVVGYEILKIRHRSFESVEFIQKK